MIPDALKQLTAWIYERPARALKIYYGGGRKAAIEEMCISCVGTAQEAKKCPCVECPLWTFRPGADKNFVPAFVPPQDELQALADGKVSDAVREHARKLGESKRGG